MIFLRRCKLLTLLILLVSPHLVFAESEDQESKPVDLFISGSLSPEGMVNLGKPIQVISKKELERSFEPTIGETLSSVPGVSSSYFGPSASRPIIRGQSNSRVRVLQNGLDTGDVSATSDDHSVISDPLTTERIDILRGPSTLLYGSQAIGGVVNSVDDSIAEAPIGREFTGSVLGQLGDSASDERTGAAVLKGQSGAINWHLSGFARETDNIEIPGFAESEKLREQESEEGEEHEEEQVRDTLPSSDSLTRSFKLGSSYVSSRGFWGVAVRRYDSEYGVPGHMHTEEHGDEHDDEHEEEGDHEDEHEHEDELEGSHGARIDMEQTRVETRGEYKLKGDFFKSIKFGGTYADYEHKELEGDHVGTIFERDVFEARTFLSHSHDDVYEGGFGMQLQYQDQNISGEEAFLPSSTDIAPALFVLEDYALSDDMSVEVGGRYEYSHIDPIDISSKHFDLFSFSSGLLWHSPEKWYGAAFNLSYSERSPNSAELFADGVHVATQTYELGDEDIQKERSVGAELVLSKDKGSLRGSVSTFWQRYFDYINLAPTGDELEGASVYFYENTGAEFWGFEVESELDLFATGEQQFVLYTSADFVSGRNTTADTYLPRVTPLRGKLGLRHNYRSVSSYVETQLVNKQDKTAPFELPTDSYALINAGLNAEVFQRGYEKIELFVKGTNLGDEEARVHTSFLKDLAPLRGRAFFAGFRAHF